MASLSPDTGSVRRTFANAHLSAQSHNLAMPTTGQQQAVAQSSQNVHAINSAVASSKTARSSRLEPVVPIVPRTLAPSASNRPASLDELNTTPILSTQILSVTSDESTTQLSSSDDSAKPPSLDGKSVASVTTFAMDEKESLRPDDSASVLAIEDDDIYSPPGSAPIDSRLGSDTGARAFRDQLLEITAGGSALHQSIPTSRPDSATNAPVGTLYVPPPVGSPAALAGFVQPPTNIGRPEDVLADPKLLEALNNPRDRIWVLKLEQDIIDFVKDPS
jgi:hypothetical protein